MGITPEKMRGVPRISHLLECAEGGVDACIGALRLSDDPDAERFLGKYDSLRKSDRNRVTIEEISIAAGVPVKNLLASALLAVEYVGTSAARMATASFSAPVIKAVGQRAISGPSPTANSKLFLSGSGFLPRPANREPGVFVNITNQNAAAARALHEANESTPPPQIEASPVKPYIPAETELRALHGELDATRMLEGPAEDSAAVEIGGVFKDSEELQCIPSGK